jgi:hypothetical protein
MNTDGISLLGWIHIFVCPLALISGALQLAGRKGTPAHARRGNVYFLSMAIANVTALFIFHGDLLIRSRRLRASSPSNTSSSASTISYVSTNKLPLHAFSMCAATGNARCSVFSRGARGQGTLPTWRARQPRA